MKKSFYFLFSLILLGACQESDLPVGGSALNRPEFELSGLLNGQAVHHVAGEGTLFLNTQLQKDPLSVYEMQSAIYPLGCSNCTDYFELSLRDYKVIPDDGAMLPDSSIQCRAYDYQLGGSGADFRNIRLSSQPDGGSINPAIRHEWEIRSSPQNRLIARFEGQNPEIDLKTGNYVIGLTSSFANGCSNSINLPTTIDANTGNCEADFSLLRFQGTTVAQLDTTNIQVTRPFTYRWLINGEPTQVQQPFLFFDSIASPVFQITLIVTGNGCEVRKTKNISRNPDAFCAANFRINNLGASDPLQLGKVRLDYVATNSSRFSSSFESQPDWANFEIEAILPYQADRNGLPTRHITGRLDCRLSTEDGSQSVELRQARFRLALPYKP